MDKYIERCLYILLVLGLVLFFGVMLTGQSSTVSFVNELYTKTTVTDYFVTYNKDMERVVYTDTTMIQIVLPPRVELLKTNDYDVIQYELGYYEDSLNLKTVTRKIDTQLCNDMGNDCNVFYFPNDVYNIGFYISLIKFKDGKYDTTDSVIEKKDVIEVHNWQSYLK